MFSRLKKCFYQFIPTAHVSAYIRWLYFRKYLKKIVFGKALDAGCGPGLFSFFVAKSFSQSTIEGFDKSLANIRLCNQQKKTIRVNNISFKPVDLTLFSEKNRYDFIFSIDVLEHIPGNLKVMLNIYNGLEPGGIFYLAMPYEPGHRYLFPRRFFKNYIEWTLKEHIGEQYPLSTITEVLRQIGFTIIEARYAFGFWGKLAWELDMLTERKKIIKHFLQPLLFFWGYLDVLWKNGPGSYAVVVIAKK